MKVLVLGCGSIGTRRAKILVEMGHDVYGYDPAFDRKRWLEWYAEVGARGSVGVGGQIPEKIEVALICTPPDSDRLGQVRKLARSKIKGLFIEKPLATSPGLVVDLIARAVETPYAIPVTMGACNLRFSKGVEALRKVSGENRIGFFDMGLHEKYWSAGHEPISMVLDSIHELDLAVSLLGPIKSIRGCSTSMYAELSVHHDGGWSEISLDRFSDPPRRVARIGDADNLLTVDEMIHIDTDPSMYVREMQHFMDCVEAGMPTCNPIEDAAEVCRWALEVA